MLVAPATGQSPNKLDMFLRILNTLGKSINLSFLIFNIMKGKPEDLPDATNVAVQLNLIAFLTRGIGAIMEETHPALIQSGSILRVLNNLTDSVVSMAGTQGFALTLSASLLTDLINLIEGHSQDHPVEISDEAFLALNLFLLIPTLIKGYYMKRLADNPRDTDAKSAAKIFDLLDSFAGTFTKILTGQILFNIYDPHRLSGLLGRIFGSAAVTTGIYLNNNSDDSTTAATNTLWRQLKTLISNIAKHLGKYLGPAGSAAIEGFLLKFLRETETISDGVFVFYLCFRATMMVTALLALRDMQEVQTPEITFADVVTDIPVSALQIMPGSTGDALLQGGGRAQNYGTSSNSELDGTDTVELITPAAAAGKTPPKGPLIGIGVGDASHSTFFSPRRPYHGQYQEVHPQITGTATAAMGANKHSAQ